MKNLVYSLLMLFVSFSLQDVFSQQTPDKQHFVITCQGDTIFGEVKKTLLRKSDKVTFVPAGQSKEVVYSPLDIKAFYSMAEGLFVSAIVDLDISPTDVNSLRDDPNPLIINDTLFLEVIITGKATLYALDDDQMKLHFFISKEGSPVKELINYSYIDKGETYWDAANQAGVGENEKSNNWNPKDAIRNVRRYKGMLNYFFADCPEATKRIEKLSFDEKGLSGIVNIYNNCQGNVNEKPTTEQPKNRIEMLGFIGPSFSGVDYNMKGKQILGFNQKYGFVAGADMIFKMRYKYRFAAAVNSLHLSLFETEGENHFENGVVYYDQYATIMPVILSLSTMVRLSYPDLKFTPFINFGVRNVFIFLNKNTFEVTTTVGGVPSTRTSELVIDHYKYHLSAVAGAGIQYKRFGIEIRYFPYFGMEIDPAVGRGLSFSSFDLNLGYKFLMK